MHAIIWQKKIVVGLQLLSSYKQGCLGKEHTIMITINIQRGDGT